METPFPMRKRSLILSAVAVVATAATVWIAVPASAAAPTATFTKVSDWGTGWEGSVVIKNTGVSAMTSWKVEFDLPAGGTIGSFWDADMTANGNHRTFVNRSWNGSVAVGASTSFGMIGSGGAPANCLLNGAPCSGSGGPAPTTAPTTRPTVAPTVAPTTAPTTKPPTTAPTAPPTNNPAPPPASSLLPFTITNKTGRSDAVYLYVLGTNLNTGRLGWVNRDGAFSPWPAGQPVPVPAPDASIAGPGQGGSVTVKVPKFISGRVYLSLGKKLDFRLTPDGLVQPAPWAADPNKDILFDWSEFTLNSSGLWLNSSQVDMFAVPHIVSVQDGTGATAKTGELVPGGRQKVIDAIKADSEFSRSVYTRGDGTVLRVLAPGKAAGAGLMSASFLDSYISTAWNTYATKTLTVTPFTDQPNNKFLGRTSGNTMNFTDSSGRVVASFTKPTTANVWGCDGALAAPNDLVVGPIARTLCAALTRTTLAKFDVQPSGKASDFYQGNPHNVYAKVIHDTMVDGKAYAFAFDDVQNQESLVHAGDPRAAGIVLTPF